MVVLVCEELVCELVVVMKLVVLVELVVTGEKFSVTGIPDLKWTYSRLLVAS